MGRDDLRELSRDDLIALAVVEGIGRAGTLSRSELVDALERQRAGSSRSGRVGGLLAVARRLVRRVVERGLHLPQAAELLGWGAKPPQPRPAPPPLATVTLAEIYAAQGHLGKAVTVLDEVLARDADDAEAQQLRARLVRAAGGEPAARGRQGDADGEVAPAPPSPGSDRGAAEAPAGLGDEAPQVGADAPPPANAEVAGGTHDGAGAADPPSDELAPLPARYGVDEVVALATDPRTAYVYWELRPRRFARARWRDPEGKLVLRVLTVAVCGDGTEQMLRDLEVSALVGDRFIRGLTPGSELRLCLGWVGGKSFTPLAVAAEMQMPRDHARRAPATDWVDTAALRGVWAEATRDSASGPSAAAAKRLRGYLAQVVQSRRPQMVELAAMATRGQPAGIERTTLPGAPLLGGASDLGAAPPGELAALAYGGASDLIGGASDLSGGAGEAGLGASLGPGDVDGPA